MRAARHPELTDDCRDCGDIGRQGGFETGAEGVALSADSLRRLD
jgi:hypothetical protein